MSTRSNIAVEHCNGAVSDIYCHSDGYLSHNGVLLHKNWTSTSAVRSLILLGDISSLGVNLNDVQAYFRDRGEELSPARKHTTLDEYFAATNTKEYRKDWGYEYCYILTRKNGWLVKEYDDAWRPLYLALTEEALTDET